MVVRRSRVRVSLLAFTQITRHATAQKKHTSSLLECVLFSVLLYDEAREREETNEVSGFELHVSCFTWKHDDSDRDEANEVSVIEVMPRDAREST